MATIICEECATERTHTPSNTKLCRECAVLRDLTFMKDSTRTCSQSNCETQFVPVRRNDSTCGNCDRSVYQGHCKVCGREDRELLAKDLAVCLGCAKDSVKRVKLIDRLRERRSARRSTNEAPAL